MDAYRLKARDNPSWQFTPINGNFLIFSTRNHLLSFSRKATELKYHGNVIMIYPDFPLHMF